MWCGARGEGPGGRGEEARKPAQSSNPDPASQVQVSYWLIALALCAVPGRPCHPAFVGKVEGGHISLWQPMPVKVSKQNSQFSPIMGLDKPIMSHWLCRSHKTFDIYDRCLKVIVKEGLIFYIQFFCILNLKLLIYRSGSLNWMLAVSDPMTLI